MADVTPASMTTDQVAFWRDHVQRHAVTTEQAESFLDAIKAEEARADRAEAERDELADWVLGADHHPGCSGTFPGHRCKCHRDDLEAILDAYVDRVTGGVEADD